MKRQFTCIVCPNGCEITAEYEGTEIYAISGQTCPKGEEYVHNELTRPLRNITSSVLVINGELPLASVKLSRMIPKAKIFDVMAEIKKLKVTAPVEAGQVVLANVLGLGSDVVITKNVAQK